ncbi:NUDIX hydrolase [Actinoplanes sp. NEAU-A12]|uniref:NUDIX hydrolase n=1 Tax=Actinoplanes sandaracinus TaxID=3045177 RepID=A0ABT6WGS1_9ACTN|nr:NUDIX hydrolase [Actinoplanes sandaracinus]MDI6098933.1 NUDIX hydrolase [Actinoplanes sandaracinus]
MTDPIRTLRSREVYRNAWMSVREDDILHADGSPGSYGVVSKPDYALIIPRDGGLLHLVEQYRYPVSERFWEFPQGSWPGDAGPADGTAEQLAVAELAEETGLRAGRMVALGRIHVAYGYASQGCHVFLAEDLTAGRPRRERSESDMRQRAVDAAGWAALVCSGAITDAATLAAFALLQMYDSGVRQTAPEGTVPCTS